MLEVRYGSRKGTKVFSASVSQAAEVLAVDHARFKAAAEWLASCCQNNHTDCGGKRVLQVK